MDIFADEKTNELNAFFRGVLVEMEAEILRRFWDSSPAEIRAEHWGYFVSEAEKTNPAFFRDAVFNAMNGNPARNWAVLWNYCAMAPEKAYFFDAVDEFAHELKIFGRRPWEKARREFRAGKGAE